MRRSGTRPVCFVGTFPPPVHGMAVLTESIADTLQELGVPIDRVDIADDDPASPPAKFRKIVRVLKTAAGLVIQPPRSLLIGADAGAGLLLQTVLVGAGRARRTSVFIFHHSPVVPAGASWIARAFVAIAGTNAIHVLNCDHLLVRMRGQYRKGIDLNLTLLSNGHLFRNCRMSLEAERNGPSERASDASGRVRIGHLANLTTSKGFGIVADAVKLLIDRGFDAEYHLAGMPADEQAERELIRLRGLLGGRLFEHGFVSGKSKKTFFDLIDVFAMPSTYSNECSPVVVWEALNAGKPVVSTRIGCMVEEELEPAGKLIDHADPAELADAFQDLLQRMPDTAVVISLAKADIERSLGQIAELASAMINDADVDTAL